MTVPVSTLSAPSGRYVLAVIGGDGCAAMLDDSAPPVALATGTMLLVAPGSSLRLIWGGTCGWTTWCLDASLVQRATVHAGLDGLVTLRAAALEDDHLCELLTALASESARSPHPTQRLVVQSLEDAFARRAPTRESRALRRRAA